MAVYNINNTQLSDVYGINDNSLDVAFDINNDIVFNKTPPTPTNTLKVMSFNVGCFYTEYYPCPDAVSNAFYQRQRTIYNAHHPDFVGMPEWYKYIGTIDSSTLMDEYWADYIANYEAYNGSSKPNNAITFASTYPITNNSIVAYQTQSGEVRYYQKGYITVDGITICVVNTHLSLTSNIRAGQFNELLNMLENEEYFICVGDFNFQIQQAGDSEYNASVQLALNKGFNSAQNANSILKTWYSGQTAETSSNIYALDNIITSANLPISNVMVDTTKLTDGLCTANNIIIDHLPIIADVTLPSS